MRVAAPTAAQIADAKTTLEMYFYEASENGEAPGFSVPAEDCSAKAQAFLAVSGPGKECDLDKENAMAMVQMQLKKL